MCSSDQVYFRKQGEQESLEAYLEPHREDCSETPEPLYGKQKLQGEEICLKYQPESVVLRLSWMYDSLTEDELAKADATLQRCFGKCSTKSSPGNFRIRTTVV